MGSCKERLDDCADVEFPEVRVFLAHSNIQHRFACCVAHGYCCAHLVVNCVELREDYTIDLPLRVDGTELGQGLIELADLIDSIIPHQSLSNEDDQVRLVHIHQSSKCFHQRSVVLHSTSCID